MRPDTIPGSPDTIEVTAPILILINGSGLGLSALVAFLVFGAWLVTREVQA